MPGSGSGEWSNNGPGTGVRSKVPPSLRPSLSLPDNILARPLWPGYW